MFMFELYPMLLLVFLVPKASTLSVEFKAEYYSNITLVCDDSLLNLPYTTFKKYWILPNGSQFQWSYTPDNYSRFKIGEYPDFNLTITHIDEEDFGWYYCVILWDNYIYLVHTIKVGLNVEGALYEELLDQYKKSAITGLIAGASTASLLGLCCLLYWCRYSETNTKNEEKRVKKDEAKSESSSTESKADTVYAREKEAIYELDKAVKEYDDDVTVAGDGEVALTLKGEENVDNNSLVEDGMPLKVFEPISTQEEIILQELTMSRSADEGNSDCYDRVPPPPPPPPLIHHSSKETSPKHGYINNCFDIGNDATNVVGEVDMADTETECMFQEETIQHDKQQYADVNF